MKGNALCRINDGDVRPCQADITWPAGQTPGEWRVQAQAMRDDALWRLLGSRAKVEIKVADDTVWVGEAYLTQTGMSDAASIEHQFPVYLEGAGGLVQMSTRGISREAT